MGIEVESTTDTQEQIDQAMAGMAEASNDEAEESEQGSRAASEDKPQDETGDESASSEDSEEEDAEDPDEDQDEESDSDDDEQEEDDQDSEDDEADPKKGARARKRIKKLASKLSQKDEVISSKDEEILFLRRQLEARNQGKQEDPSDEAEESRDASPSAEASDRPQEPMEEDFEQYSDYKKAHSKWVEDLTDWKLDQREKAKEEKAKADEIKTKAEKTIEAHNARIDKFRETNPEYDKVLGKFVKDHGDASFSIGLEEAVVTSDLGPAIIFELAKNPDEFDRINALSPLAAAREIGKIESRLSKPAQTEEKPTKKVKSNAPKPVSPTGGKGPSGGKKNLSEITDFAEYEAARRAGQGA